METTLSKPKIFSMRQIIEEEPGSRQFLESIARRSKQTRRTYAAGLLAFHRFLNGKQTLFGILEPLRKGELDVYVLLNDFIHYLMTAKNPLTGRVIATQTIEPYMTAVRSYFQFYDVDISIAKFKRKVKMPVLYREDEQALDVADIRKLMLTCTNRRLRAYLLILASGGLRASEACAIRLCDIDFTSKPTKVHVRREYAKTRVSRDIYISDEATQYLQQWIEWKYRTRRHPSKWGTNDQVRTRNQEDLVFTHQRKSIIDPRTLYGKIRKEFIAVLIAAGFEKRKDGGVYRRTITLHSFRRYVKTVISDQVSKDYSEWFLGHSKSPYYTLKQERRAELYSQCMKYLTFLDYSALENKGRNIEVQLEQKDEEISRLRKRMDNIEQMLSKITETKKRVDNLVNQKNK